jgi:hypothetical protein
MVSNKGNGGKGWSQGSNRDQVFEVGGGSARKFSLHLQGKEGMELYNELASNEEATRIKAAEELLKKILDAKKNGNAEKGVEVNYALTRLVKGLSSGRESARIGFSTALTEVLHLTEDLTTAFA